MAPTEACARPLRTIPARRKQPRREPTALRNLLLTRMLKRNPPRLKAATLKLRRSGTPERARPEPMPLEQARRPSHNVKRAASRSSRQPTARLRWAGTIRRRSVTLVAARQFTALAATADRRAKRDVSEVPHSVFDLG